MGMLLYSILETFPESHRFGLKASVNVFREGFKLGLK
jgi:hypothetical protein